MESIQIFWLCVHIFGILVAFFLLFMVFRIPDTDYKSYLLVAACCCVVIMTSKCLHIIGTNLRELVAVAKLEYLGKCFVLYCAIGFILHYYRVSWPKWLMRILLAINCIFCAIIMTCDYHHLYYTSLELGYKPYGYVIIHGKAPLYWFYMGVMVLEMLIYLFIVVNPHYNTHRTKHARSIRFMLSVSAVCPLILLVLYLVGATGGFDTIPLGILLSAVFIVVTENLYGMLDPVSNAKESVMESMSEGIIVSDENMRLLYANPAACHIFPDMAKGEDGVKPSEIQAIFEHAGTVIDLYEHSYEVRASELWQEDQLTGHLISIVDITDAVNQTRLMRDLKDKAEESAQTKSAFLANMSHEIRTPMNAILGMADMALSGNVQGDEREEIEQIKSASLSLLAIINDILDFSKVESGKMEIVDADYEPLVMVRDVAQMMEAKVNEKGLRLIVDVDPLLPTVLHGDELRLKQILINLVNNAVKFTEKGHVEVNMTFERSGSDIMLTFNVKDTGIGIHEEDMSRIFHSFEQSDLYRNRKQTGTGLGLAICKQLTELMGGSIYVESAYNEGSTFYVEVPQKVVDETPGGGKIEEAKSRQDNMEKEYGNFTAPHAKVLVVDDNLVNLKVAAGLMKPFKMQIDTAKSGPEAIEKAKQTQYDMIFMDHMMPEMDGVEAARRIRELDGTYYQNVPIIALTADAVSGTKEMMIEEGMNDFIAKPINIQQLSDAIAHWLPEELLEEPAET